MEKRSLFKMIFGKSKTIPKATQLQLLNGYSAVFSDYDGRLWEDAQIRSCIDAIARNGAKLNPKHLKSTTKSYKQLESNIARLLSKKPNSLMNAYDFYYKVISTLLLDNNSFIYIQRDDNENPVALYPIKPNSYTLLEYQGNVFIRFSFINGDSYTASVQDDVIHLKRFYCENDVIGSGRTPIIKTMSLQHVIDEGVINAIKTTSKLKGYLKSTKAMLDPKDVKQMKADFEKDFLSEDNTSGLGALDSTMEFKEINLDPKLATDAQIKDCKERILNYFGVSEEIIQSKYTEAQWDAFYESTLEPIALAMSLEFTIKLFSIDEQWHGNEIIFEANRLQYVGTKTKLQLVNVLAPLGVMKKNEIREIFNMTPLTDEEGGNDILQSLNNINSAIADQYQGGKDDE